MPRISFFRILPLAGKVHLPDPLHRHLHSSPDLKAGRSLIKQHVHAVEGPAAPFGSLLQEQRAFRVIDDVPDQQSRPEHGRIFDGA